MTSPRTRRAFAPLLLLLLLLLCASARPSRGQQAYKIDEAERARCDLGEVMPLNDPGRGVLLALAEQPEAKAAVVVYGLPGEAIVYAREVKSWLSEVRGVVPERVLEVYGGPAYRRRLELWLVPAGAAPPPAASRAAEGRVTLFYRYSYWLGEYCGPDRPAALKTFAETLNSLAGWRGTVVVRPHVNRRGARSGDKGYDESPLTRRQALRRASEDRLHLIRQLGVDPTRIRAVAGAPDDWAHAELWLVPLTAVRPDGGAGVRRGRPHLEARAAFAFPAPEHL